MLCTCICQYFCVYHHCDLGFQTTIGIIATFITNLSIFDGMIKSGRHCFIFENEIMQIAKFSWKNLTNIIYMTNYCLLQKWVVPWKNSQYNYPHCMHFAQEILISLVVSKVDVVLVFTTLSSCFELLNNDAS